jgi:hypothetical protein
MRIQPRAVQKLPGRSSGAWTVLHLQSEISWCHVQLMPQASPVSKLEFHDVLPHFYIDLMRAHDVCWHSRTSSSLTWQAVPTRMCCDLVRQTPIVHVRRAPGRYAAKGLLLCRRTSQPRRRCQPFQHLARRNSAIASLWQTGPESSGHVIPGCDAHVHVRPRATYRDNVVGPGLRQNNVCKYGKRLRRGNNSF